MMLDAFLWNCDLEYDSYESSMAEAIHDIECGNISIANEEIVKSAWAGVSEETFQQWCRDHYESCQRQMAELEKFL